jgi:CHORD
MKVLLHYEDHADVERWKSLKITLPKSWKNGPTSNLLSQFVETYNANRPEDEHLLVESLHLELKKLTADTAAAAVNLPSDGITLDLIPDRADVYICHGPAVTLADLRAVAAAEAAAKKAQDKHLVQCTRFGCRNRFPPDGPFPQPCTYHKSPPVFHETVKFWSCCPTQKAYDWDDFQKIPGCSVADCCTAVQENVNTKQFLGGTDLRAAANGENNPLKSIDDFNKAYEAGGAAAAPTLERLQMVLKEVGVEKELYDQVVTGLRAQLAPQCADNDEASLLEAIKNKLGGIIKATLKAEAVEQLRIK